MSSGSGGRAASHDPAAGLPIPGTVIDGKYEVHAEIGRGGMAVVYAATQLLTRRTVAIKCLMPRIAADATVVERFLREGRAATAIDHPSVVSVFDVGRFGDSFYIVMEHLTGESLRARLERGPLGLDETMRVLMPIAGALGAAHAVGIVHRDLKPENVFLRRREDGSLRAPKLLDFGISKLTREESLTLTGSILGTPYYLSPEQATASHEIGPRSDVYQLGVLAYEMLSGRVPFAGDTYEVVLVAILSARPPRLAELRPDLPPALCAAIERAMARDPAARFADVAAFARALEPFGGALDESLRSGASRPSEPRAHLVDALAATHAGHDVYGATQVQVGDRSIDAQAATHARVGDRSVDAHAPTHAHVGHSIDAHAATRAPRRERGATVPETVQRPIAQPAIGDRAPRRMSGGTLALVAMGGIVALVLGAVVVGGAALFAQGFAQGAMGTAGPVLVRSVPSAIVSAGGQPLGPTPLEIDVVAGQRLTLSARGFATRDVIVPDEVPLVLDVVLDPEPSIAPPPEAPADVARPPEEASEPAPEEPAPAAPEEPAPTVRRRRTEGETTTTPRAGHLSTDDF